MATQDNNIQYDLLFFNELSDFAYPSKPSEFKEWYMEILLRGEVQISTFVENAVALVGGHTRSSKVAMDLSDGSEVKSAVSSYRNNDIRRGSWTHSYEISNVHTKTGPIRFIGYNRIAKMCEFYFIPHHAYKHLKNTLTLPIETYSGYYAKHGDAPTFTGVRTGKSVWHKYQVSSFIEVCTRT